MSPPDAVAAAPAWLSHAGLVLGHLAGSGRVAEDDAGLALWLLHAIEGDGVPLPAIHAGQGRRVALTWQSGPHAAGLHVLGLRATVGRSDGPWPPSAPGGGFLAVIPRLRDALGWLYPRLAGGCDAAAILALCTTNPGGDL